MSKFIKIGNSYLCRINNIDEIEKSGDKMIFVNSYSINFSNEEERNREYDTISDILLEEDVKETQTLKELLQEFVGDIE